MSDEDDSSVPASEAPRRQGDLILYDYFKHLTTLSLLILGGILTLALSDKAADLKRPGVMIVLGVVAFAGIVSFSGASEIARAHFQGKDHKRVELYRKAAPAILSIGIGMFLMMFTKVIGR